MISTQAVKNGVSTVGALLRFSTCRTSRILRIEVAHAPIYPGWLVGITAGKDCQNHRTHNGSPGKNKAHKTLTYGPSATIA